MVVRRTVDLHLGGIIEFLRVPGGRVQWDLHHVSCLHRAALDFGVLHHLAGRNDDRIGAQELFDCSGDHIRIGNNPSAIFRVAGQVEETPAQRHRHSVEAGHEHQQAERLEILIADGFAVDLKIKRLADDVVLGLCAPLDHHLGESSHDGRHRGNPSFRRALNALILMQNRVLPLHELVQLVDRHTHELKEDGSGIELSEIGHEIGRSSFDQAINQLDGTLANLALELFHLLG